ncbi:MAG: hypothetical protein JXB62_08600 [Pirellulales bacterium]|nr:hypothetical protein [Pirellulales bacterium]
MTHLEIPFASGLLVMIELLGLGSAWVTRLSEGSRYETGCQLVFLGLLTITGLATIATAGMGIGYWLTSGPTVCLMALMVLCDFRRAREVTVHL